LLLVLTGIALTVVYAVRRIDLSVPVFAFVTSYMETKFFTIVYNNVFEEIIILFYLSGFLLTSFSKDKNEQAYNKNLRGDAWTKAIFANSVFLLFIVLFVYGVGFVVFMVVNLFSVFVYYHIFYWQKKRKFRIEEDIND
jgi:hypothetical protein